MGRGHLATAACVCGEGALGPSRPPCPRDPRRKPSKAAGAGTDTGHSPSGPFPTVGTGQAPNCLGSHWLPQDWEESGGGAGTGSSLQPRAAREANGPGLHSGAQALRAPRRGERRGPDRGGRRHRAGDRGERPEAPRGGSGPSARIIRTRGSRSQGAGPPRGSDHSGRPVSLPHARGGLPGGWGPRTGRGIARFRPTWSGEAAVWPQVERPAEAGGCRRAPLLLCVELGTWGDVGGDGGRG